MRRHVLVLGLFVIALLTVAGCNHGHHHHSHGGTVVHHTTVHHHVTVHHSTRRH